MKEIIIKGAIGNTKIQNNDSGRVFSRVGILGTIKKCQLQRPTESVKKMENKRISSEYIYISTRELKRK